MVSEEDSLMLINMLRKRLVQDGNYQTRPALVSDILKKEQSKYYFIDSKKLIKSLHVFFEEYTGRKLSGAISDKKKWWSDYDKFFVDQKGYGLLTFLHNFGALPGDGVDQVFELALPDGFQLTTWIATDYTQDHIIFRVNGPDKEQALNILKGVLQLIKSYC